MLSRQKVPRGGPAFTGEVAVDTRRGEKNTTPSTEPKFGEILGQLQAKFGSRSEKPRDFKKSLDKDDFMKIMVTQMRNQDPTIPLKADQLAVQMAQFASVEQLHNVNNNLTKLTSANQPMERLAMSNMIGKTVTIDRNRFPHTEGTNESLNFTLPKDAEQVRVMLVTESGEAIFQQDLGPEDWPASGHLGWRRSIGAGQSRQLHHEGRGDRFPRDYYPVTQQARPVLG